MTILLQSDATYICLIYVDIDKKVTANKPYQFKKNQFAPEESLNEARGEICLLWMKILMISNATSFAQTQKQEKSSSAVVQEHIC